MKNKIRRKLEHVRANLNKLEGHLETNGKVSKAKEIVQHPVDQLTQLLQDETLSCVEVLRAYQAKVNMLNLHTAAAVLFVNHFFPGIGSNKRIELCHRVH